MWKIVVAGMLSHLGMFSMLMNKRGEAGDGKGGDGKGGDGKGGYGKGGDKTFSQSELDTIVQDRLARQGKKFADYDDLAKFKTDHEKNTEAEKTKSLEAQNKYEELKKGWNEKEQKFNTGLAEKDKQISGLKIGHALNIELSKLNAHPEAGAILQTMVSLSEDGTPQMDGEDAVKNKVKITLAEGVKKFLEERPHLVKAKGAGGGGGTPPGGGGGEGEGEVKLVDLNAQLAAAMSVNDHKKAEEIKVKLRTFFKTKGISRDM